MDNNTDFINRIILYFDPAVLGAYQDGHRYVVETDNFEGRVKTSSAFYESLGGSRRHGEWIDVMFGFRQRRNGELALAVWGPDLMEKTGAVERRRWTGFHLSPHEFPSELDPRFQLWVARYMNGDFTVENGPLERIVERLKDINAVTLEAVDLTLFRHEESPDLRFPAAETDAAYAAAHSALYRLVLDGLERETIAALASKLGRSGKFDGERTKNALRRLVNDPSLDPAIFDPLERVSGQRRLADHGVQQRPKKFDAFDAFSRDAEAVVGCLVALRDYLSTALDLDVERCVVRRERFDLCDRLDRARPTGAHYAMQQAQRIVGKTIARVEYGFRKPIERVHDSELLILHFTDGSMLSLDTGSNVWNITADREDLKPEDFHCDFRPHFIPPPKPRR